jgi:hypothetical protein
MDREPAQDAISAKTTAAATEAANGLCRYQAPNRGRRKVNNA